MSTSSTRAHHDHTRALYTGRHSVDVGLLYHRLESNGAILNLRHVLIRLNWIVNNRSTEVPWSVLLRPRDANSTYRGHTS